MINLNFSQTTHPTTHLTSITTLTTGHKNLGILSGALILKTLPPNTRVMETAVPLKQQDVELEPTQKEETPLREEQWDYQRQLNLIFPITLC